jgi:hypothetical protein
VFLVPGDVPLPFTLFYPVDALAVVSPTIWVVGATLPDASILVNGAVVTPNQLGLFSHSVPLAIGSNIIEVLVSTLEGNLVSKTVVVFRLPG